MVGRGWVGTSHLCARLAIGTVPELNCYGLAQKGRLPPFCAASVRRGMQCAMPVMGTWLGKGLLVSVGDTVAIVDLIAGPIEQMTAFTTL